MTKAVLGDAIALVRGDRFNTTEFTRASFPLLYCMLIMLTDIHMCAIATALTAWGYNDCKRDPFNGGSGGELPKLLMRHLPDYYPYVHPLSLPLAACI